MFLKVELLATLVAFLRLRKLLGSAFLLFKGCDEEETKERSLSDDVIRAKYAHTAFCGFTRRFLVRLGTMMMMMALNTVIPLKKSEGFFMSYRCFQAVLFSTHSS